jgi:hypothetical protein
MGEEAIFVKVSMAADGSLRIEGNIPDQTKALGLLSLAHHELQHALLRRATPAVVPTAQQLAAAMALGEGLKRE